MSMTISRWGLALVLAFALVPLHADEDGIAAIVNRDPITFADINFDVQAW